MEPLVSPEIGDRRLLRETQQFRFEATFGQAARATAARALPGLPGVALFRMRELSEAQGELVGQADFRKAHGLPPPPRLTADEWRTGPHFRDGLVYPEKGYTETAAALIAERFDKRQRQDAIISRASQDFLTQAGLFGVGLGTNVIDPLSIAASFVPVVGQMRYAALVRTFGKTGGRAAKGSIEGLVGNLALEPIVFQAAREDQADYTMADSLMNVAFGAVLGAGLHVGAGAAGDAIARFRAPTREVAFKKAVGDIVEGRPVDVAMVARNDPLFVGTTLSTRSVGDIVGDAAATLRQTPAEARPARGDAAAPIAPAAPAQTLVASQERGGVRVFESQRMAERAARRVKRRRGDDLDVTRIGEDEFVLTRTTPIEFLRGTDGTVSQFPTERAARRTIDRLRDAEGLDVVPVGPAGPERRFALVRNATARDLRDIRARPEAVDVTAAEPVVRAFDEAGAPVAPDQPRPAVLAAQPAPARVDVLDATGQPRRVSGRRVSLQSAADPDVTAAEAVARQLDELDELGDDLSPEAVALLDEEVEALRATGRVTAEDDAEIAEAIADVAKLEDAENVYVATARCLVRAA